MRSLFVLLPLFFLFLISPTLSWNKDDPTVTTDGRTIEDLLAFEEWLTAKGIDVSPFNIRILPASEGGGMGVYANKPFDKGEVILKVKCGTINLNGSEIHQKMFPEYKTTYSHESLVVYLLWCKSHPSECDHTPYLNLIPRDYTFLPMYWNFTEIIEQATFPQNVQYLVALQQGMQNTKASFVTRHNEMLSKLKEAGLPDFVKGADSYSDFEWASLAVNTRAWSDNLLQNPQSHVVMNPLYDMFNHHHEGAMVGSHFEDGNYYSVLNATFAYEVGDQLYDCYGHVPNTNLLNTWGFTMCNNTKNYLAIQLPVPEWAAQYSADARQGFLSHANFFDLNDVALRAGRFSAFSKRECVRKRNCVDMIRSGKFLSFLNEVMALRNILAAELSSPWPKAELEEMIADPSKLRIPMSIVCLYYDGINRRNKLELQAFAYWRKLIGITSDTPPSRISQEQIDALKQIVIDKDDDKDKDKEAAKPEKEKEEEKEQASTPLKNSSSIPVSTIPKNKESPQAVTAPVVKQEI